MKDRCRARFGPLRNASEGDLSAGLLAGAMTLPASAQQIAAATTPKFRVQPLSFNPEKIHSLSAKAIASHHGEHYAAAVWGTCAWRNATMEQLNTPEARAESDLLLPLSLPARVLSFTLSI